MFSKLGTERSKGTKVFALAGSIRNSGLIEVPMGMRLRDIVFDIGGGIPMARASRRYRPAVRPEAVSPTSFSTRPSIMKRSPAWVPSWDRAG